MRKTISTLAMYFLISYIIIDLMTVMKKQNNVFCDEKFHKFKNYNIE